MTTKTICDLWEELSDIPCDDSGNTEESFLGFEVGTNREEIWHWFDQYIPVHRLLYELDDVKAECDAEIVKPQGGMIMDFHLYENACYHLRSITEIDSGKKIEFRVADAELLNTVSCLACDNHGAPLMLGNWYAIITCKNGYKYYVNVTYDSVIAMCSEIMNFIQYK